MNWREIDSSDDTGKCYNFRVWFDIYTYPPAPLTKRHGQLVQSLEVRCASDDFPNYHCVPYSLVQFIITAKAGFGYHKTGDTYELHVVLGMQWPFERSITFTTVLFCYKVSIPFLNFYFRLKFLKIQHVIIYEKQKWSTTR